MMLHQKEQIPLFDWLSQNCPGVRFHQILATDLKAFSASCPPSWEIDSREIVQNNCIFPFVSPFLSPEARKIHLAWADQNSGYFPPLRSTSRSIVPQSIYRACRECVRRDKDNFKEPYLHREHHLPGVDVCLVHASRLIPIGRQVTPTPVLWKNLNAVGDLTEKDVQTLGSRILNRLAERVSRLLTRPIQEDENLDLWPVYRWQLRKMGMKKSEIALGLVSRLLTKYAPIAPYLQIESWVDQPLRSFRRRRTKLLPPIAHLILQDFCGLTLDDAFKFGGRGLVPCLNPFCDFDSPEVTEKGPKKYQANCQRCGFIASFNPTGALGEKVRYTVILRRGPVYEEGVKSLFREGVSVRRISEIILRAEPATREILKDLGCKDFRPTKKRRTVSEEERSAKEQHVHLARRNKYRARLLEFRKKYPKASRTKISHVLQTTSNWLRRYDLAWFEGNVPPSHALDHFGKIIALQLGTKAAKRKSLQKKKT
jgi:hypothetical protein